MGDMKTDPGLLKSIKPIYTSSTLNINIITKYRYYHQGYCRIPVEHRILRIHLFYHVPHRVGLSPYGVICQQYANSTTGI